jgi:hypothetical protein
MELRLDEKLDTSHVEQDLHDIGLNEEQQQAIADLWDWHEQSLKSTIVLGGPYKP